MSKRGGPLTTPFFPPSPRRARQSDASDLLVQRRRAWRSFFFISRATNPLFLANQIVTRNSLLPQTSFSPKQTNQRRRKGKNPIKTKENKIVPLGIKRAGLLPFFRRATQIFFSPRKYLDPVVSLIFSANPKQKIQKDKFCVPQREASSSSSFVVVLSIKSARFPA